MSTMRRALLATLVLLGTHVASATDRTVNSTADTNTVGTLRYWILNANAGDVIKFSIGSGVQTITLSGALPFIAKSITIDGSTQPGWAGTPLIVIDGNGLNTDGLQLTAGGTSIISLAIVNFGHKGIVMTTAGGNSVTGCYIGLAADGVTAAGNGDSGISISTPTGNTIGGSTSPARNVISGNVLHGISMTTGGNSITGNYIGTNATGTAAVGNHQSGVSTSANNTIGGSVAGQGNLISGNGSSGITVTNASVTAAAVKGNLIGTNAAGTAAIPNALGGIYVTSVSGLTIGGTLAAERNVISGNTNNGILMGGNSGTTVEGNYIGTNAAGTGALPNASSGIRILTGGATIGGTSAGARNILSGNGGDGVTVDSGVTSVAIQGNYIGTNAAGTAAVPNAGGVSVAGPCTVGGTAAGAGNVISGNTTNGIGISGSGVVVEGNKLGTNPTGDSAIPNGSGGIRVLPGGAGTLIGGTLAGAGNVISGNTDGTGITVDNGVTGVTIQRNTIGLDSTGTNALPNVGGIRMYGTDCTIGGASAGNTISGNTTDGISLSGTGTLVQGNYIGLDVVGTSARGNAIGIRVYTSNGNTIGGTAANLRNVISGNFRGITLEYGSTGNTIQGNYIGTNASGTGPVANAEEGIAVGSPHNTIGGTVAGAGNVISGNYNGYGIWIEGATAFDTKVYGNKIGTAPDGVTPVPNVFGVVVSESYSNVIGGTLAGQANIIAGNSYEGVRIQFGYGNTISGNSMFGNVGLGIDLEPNGPATNDPLDADTGANRQQNYPVLSSVTASGGTTTILGTLMSAASAKFRVEFFGSTTCNPTGMGEGKTYLGSADLTTDVSGNAAINSSLPVASPGSFVAATATSENGDTSEFSPCAAVGGPNPGTIQLADVLLVTTEADGNAHLVVTRSGGTQGAVSVHYATADDLAHAPSDYADTNGTLNFADGEFIKTILVPLVADSTPEPQENFHFNLSSPGGGAVLGSQTSTNILLDDESLTAPYVSVQDVTITEGNSGTKVLHVPVTMSVHSGTVTVTLQTDDGSALAGEDYVAANHDLVFGPADTMKTFDVTINGDTKLETDETFFVRVTHIAPDGYVVKAEAEEVILNDDGVLKRGDANADGTIDVADVFYMINTLFAAGPPSIMQCLPNANADGGVDVSDVFFEINYLFAGGPAPNPPNC